jgi:hypothetical protein
MKRLVLALSLGFALVASGCDDDNDNKPVDAKTDVPAGDGGGDANTAGKCTGTYSQINRTQLGQMSSGSGKCANMKDLDFICTANLADRARACGITCLGSGALPAAIPGCVSMCIQGSATTPDLTMGCADCYRDLFSCTLAKCNACTTDPSSAACTSCQQTQGCLPTFFQCSGLPGGTLTPDAGVDATPDALDAGADRPPETNSEVGGDTAPDGGVDATDATAG